jgi:hypothetical protein
LSASGGSVFEGDDGWSVSFQRRLASLAGETFNGGHLPAHQLQKTPHKTRLLVPLCATEHLWIMFFLRDLLVVAGETASREALEGIPLGKLFGEAMLSFETILVDRQSRPISSETVPIASEGSELIKPSLIFTLSHADRRASSQLRVVIGTPALFAAVTGTLPLEPLRDDASVYRGWPLP